jgi:hypothetical protein
MPMNNWPERGCARGSRGVPCPQTDSSSHHQPGRPSHLEQHTLLPAYVVSIARECEYMILAVATENRYQYH